MTTMTVWVRSLDGHVAIGRQEQDQVLPPVASGKSVKGSGLVVVNAPWRGMNHYQVRRLNRWAGGW